MLIYDLFPQRSLVRVKGKLGQYSEGSQA